MGAVPSRECTSLFSYFRGTYEVGMVPLTKHYFAADADTVTAAAGDQRSPRLAAHADTRSHMRKQLRQQLLLMRQDSAVLYANARDVENILKSMSQQKHGKNNGTRVFFTEKKNPSPEPSTVEASSAAGVSGTSADVRRDAHNNTGTSVQEANTTKAYSTGDCCNNGCESTSAADEMDGSAATADQPSSMQNLLTEYWSIMPDNNFTEEDLDRFLALVDATLFETNDDLLSSDPVFGSTAEASSTSRTKPFLPVPCALCLAYPDGKERDGAFSLDGRVINIIGYFGLMTREMQEALKVVKRLPSEVERRQQQQHEVGSASAPLVFLNTAILTSAGDRTLERVLVLAAVMLRQQFHTIGRRHLLQMKLEKLLREEKEEWPNFDSKMMNHLKLLLALPPRVDPKEPFFDPLLEFPLPNIPSSIYRPTQYINAVFNETSQNPNVPPRNSSLHPALSIITEDGHVPTGGVELGASPTGASSTADVPSASSPSIGPCGPDHGFRSENRFTSLKEGGGVSLAADAPATSPYAGHTLPLTQAEEDAITFALCRRMERMRVGMEAAGNNYSALKSLTENFAFLCCQIMLHPNLTSMELIELPALIETPLFKPAAFAMTAASTLDTAAAAVEKKVTATIPQATTSDPTNSQKVDQPSRPYLSPASAVLIKLDPRHVCQATMWASSFFHCPRLLPKGHWVKYKLKDECEQLRHVLQNKDMLIAHWRKTHVDQAEQYLGKHTARLLEHVRALQLETEEARALPAEYWKGKTLYVNQDGRKYALYESRYGTMLIGVRAFAAAAAAAANGCTTASTNNKEARAVSTKVAANSSAISFPNCSATLSAHEGLLNATAGILHSIDNDSGHGLANAPRSAGPQSMGVSGVRTGHSGVFGPNNGDGLSPINMKNGINIKVCHSRRGGGNIGDSDTVHPDTTPYVNHTANNSSGKNAYATAPFVRSQVFMSRSNDIHNSASYMDSNNRRQDGMVQLRASPLIPGYPVRVSSGYDMPPPQHQPQQQQQQCVNVISTILNPQMTRFALNGGYPHTGRSPAYDMAGWTAAQSRGGQAPPYPVSSHIDTAPKKEHLSEAMGTPSGLAYVAATPLYHATCVNTKQGGVGVSTSASFPQQQQQQQQTLRVAGKKLAPPSPRSELKYIWKNVEVPRASRPVDVAPSTVRQSGSISATSGAGERCPYGCVGMNRGEFGASVDFFSTKQCDGSAAQRHGDPNWTCSHNGSSTTGAGVENAAVLQRLMPWSLKDATGWECSDADSDDTAENLLRRTRLLDVGDGYKKASPSGETHNVNNCEAGSSRTAPRTVQEDTLVGHAADRVSNPPPSPNVDASIFNMLLASASHSQESKTAISATSRVCHLPPSTIAKPSKAPPVAPFRTDGAFPVYVVQLPAPLTEQQRHQLQSQQQLSTIPPSVATVPSSGKPIYYTLPNSVPFLFQPGPTTGRMAVAYAQAPSLPPDSEAATPYAVVPRFPRSLQHQQQPIHVTQKNENVVSMSDPSRLQVAQVSAHTNVSWNCQHSFLPSGVVELPHLFTSHQGNPFPRRNGLL